MRIRCFILNLLFVANVHAHAQVPSVQEQVWSLTEVMYHDVINPPAAARFYAYCLLAGYEVSSQADEKMPRLQHKFRSYPESIRKPGIHVNLEFASLYAILETGKNIIPSGFLISKKQESLKAKFSFFNNEPWKLKESVEYAEYIAALITQYSRTDGYFGLSTRMRYKLSDAEDAWRPTPPEYMAAVEPHWNTIRTFFIDTLESFKPTPATKFERNSSSEFFKLMTEVYEVSKKLTEDEKLIANFWDCNPFAVQFQGHMAIGLKKISPGGHWMGITGIACKNAALSHARTLFIHAAIAMTLHDAFTSCWHEKYRSNRIRPETAINKYIDEKWKPLLQTPPFPEYSSGHSVISTAAAEVLTYFLGDKFHFIDTTEKYIGLPERTFSSFRSAAAEARISRLYGGIHFRDAIENGGEQGRRIGEFVISKIKSL